MLEVCTLASGSSGNATLIIADDATILIDAGISARRLTAALFGLSIDPASLSAILLTHDHIDHVRALPMFLKNKQIPVYAVKPVLSAIFERLPGESSLFALSPGGRFQLGSLSVTALETPHDASASCCYILEHSGRRLVYATDLGHMPPTLLSAFLGAHMAIIEANYDEEMLRCGSYPAYIKRRISGSYGHLSNSDCAHVSRALAKSGTSRILLAHLSENNNTPERAYNTVLQGLQSDGLEIEVTVCPRNIAGERYVV